MMKIIENEPHMILHKQIYECKCKPWRKGVDYCDNCQKAVVDFMNEHGAGVLTNDIVIEGLLKDCVKLAKENMSLKKRLEVKIRRVEELKEKVKSMSILTDIGIDFDETQSD